MQTRIRAFDVPLGTVFIVHNPGEKEARATLRLLPPTEHAIRDIGSAYCTGWFVGGALGSAEGFHYARGLPLRSAVASVLTGIISRGTWFSNRFAYAGAMSALVDQAAQQVVHRLMEPLLPQAPVGTPPMQPPSGFFGSSLFGGFLKDLSKSPIAPPASTPLPRHFRIVPFEIPSCEHGTPSPCDGLLADHSSVEGIGRQLLWWKSEGLLATARNEWALASSILKRTFPAMFEKNPPISTLPKPCLSLTQKLLYWKAAAQPPSTSKSSRPWVDLSTEALGAATAGAVIGYHLLPFGSVSQRVRKLLSTTCGLVGLCRRLRQEEQCLLQLHQLLELPPTVLRVATTK